MHILSTIAICQLLHYLLLLIRKSAFHRIRREGLKWNRKRVLRVYRQMKLKLRRKHKKRLPGRDKCPLEVPLALNECWSMDLASLLLRGHERFTYRRQNGTGIQRDR